MATTLSRCPVAIDLCITRGDTAPFGFEIVDSAGSPVDLTGKSYLFTVNTLEDPPDATTQVMQITGSVSSNVVSINMSTTEADQLGELFYDLQETDGSGAIFTLAKGKMEFKQDITKA